MDKDRLIELIEKYFDTMNSALGTSVDILMQSPEEFSPSLAAAADSIFATLLGTGYVLVALFFMIDLAAKSIMLETGNWEVIAKLFLRFLIAKVIVDNCKGIMYAIFFSFQRVLDTVSTAEGSPLGDAAKNAIVNEVNTMDPGWFNMGYFLYYVELLPSLLIVWGVSLIAGVIVIGRMFEIMVYTAIGPLPLATLAGEATTDTAKRFIQNYVAVCLQGLIIIICFRFFGGIIADAYTGNTNIFIFIMLSIVFALTIMKSGTWAKQVVGTM